MAEEDLGKGGQNAKDGKPLKSDEEIPLQEFRLVPMHQHESVEIYSQEIDLKALIKNAWEQRKLVYKITLISLFLGIMVSFIIPIEYDTSSTLLPEISSESSGGGGASKLLQQYGGLIGLGGDFSAGTESIPVQLYPRVVSSAPFLKELIYRKVDFKSIDSTTIFKYFDEYYQPNFLLQAVEFVLSVPSHIKNIFVESGETRPMVTKQGEDVIFLSKKEWAVISEMQDRVSATLDKDSGIITIRAKMPDPIASAELGRSTVEILTRYLSDYRLEKVRSNLSFVTDQYEQAETRFKEIQNELAQFRDENKNLATAKAQTTEQRLQAEYDLAFNVYNNLAQRMVTARLKVQEQTPIFKVLQPVIIPLERSQPNRKLILIISVLAGMLSSVGFIVVKELLKI